MINLGTQDSVKINLMFEHKGWKIVHRAFTKWVVFGTAMADEATTLECTEHGRTVGRKPEQVFKYKDHCEICGKPPEKIVSTFNLL